MPWCARRVRGPAGDTRRNDSGILLSWQVLPARIYLARADCIANTLGLVNIMATVDATEINPFVGPMLKARRKVMRAFAGLLAFGAIVGVMAKYPVITEWAVILAVVALCTIIVWGCIVTWYYLYRAARQEAGSKYAVSHLVLSVLLTFLGAILVPMLVIGDIERRHQASSEETG